MTCAGANVPSSASGHEGLVLDPTAPATDNGDPARGPTPTMQVGIASCIAPGAMLAHCNANVRSAAVCKLSTTQCSRYKRRTSIQYFVTIMCQIKLRSNKVKFKFIQGSAGNIHPVFCYMPRLPQLNKVKFKSFKVLLVIFNMCLAACLAHQPQPAGISVRKQLASLYA